MSRFGGGAFCTSFQRISYVATVVVLSTLECVKCLAMKQGEMPARATLAWYIGSVPTARRRRLELGAELLLDFNKLGDGFVTAFVALLDEGGLANVEELYLGSNAISDAGMRELAAAVARGGLPKCTDLTLDDNPGSAAPVQEALARRFSS